MRKKLTFGKVSKTGAGGMGRGGLVVKEWV
jgi:hypothetical protein